MKVLTPLTGSAGLDVSSANVDSINLGSSGSENSDANVDNLTVWANADFKNNITLGSSVADTVILNAPIYGSGALRIGSIDASGSSDVAVKIGTKRPLSSLDTTFKALQVVTSLGSGSEQEILSVRPDNSGLVTNAGVLEFAQPPTNKAAINITPGNGFAGVISWGGWNGGSTFGVFNGQTLYGLTANRNIKFETDSDAFFPANQPNQSFIVSKGDSSGLYSRPTQFLFRGSPWVYTTGIKSIFKLGTLATGSQITGSDRILSLRTGIDTVAESEKLYINMSGTIASTSGTLVLTSDAASASGDIGVKVGTTLTDGTISGQTKLFAISTGIGGTESEKLSVKNGSLANGFSIESAGTSGKILMNNSIGTSIAWSSISSINVDSLRASISAPEAKIYSNVASGSSDIAVKVGTTVADSAVDLNTKLLSVRTELTGTEKEYFYVSKNFVSASRYVGDGSLLTGITASAMQDMRKLLYYINNGPADTYSQAYLEITPSGSLFPTSSIWYTDSSKTAKIYEEYYERYSGSATQTKPNPIQYKLYQADGVNVLITATDTITYAGPTILSISRSIT